MMRLLSFLLIALFAAACGTAATPVYLAPTQDVVAEVTSADGQSVAVVPTATMPPTATPIPPTATPTEAPTEIPTEVPTEAPAVVAVADPLAGIVALASASRGETLFNQNFETAMGQWACTTCHNVDNDAVKIGPSLLGLPQRAGETVEGEGPYTYSFNSIKYSQVYIVPEFVGMTMMPDYEGVLTDAQIYDLVAYLMTLNN